MPKGKYKDLVIEDRRPIADLFWLVIKESDTVYNEKAVDRGKRGLDNVKRWVTYERKRNVIIACFFSMMRVKQINNGITFSISPAGTKDHLKINELELPIFTTSEIDMLAQMFHEFHFREILVKENSDFVRYSIKFFTPYFKKFFGEGFVCTYTNIRNLPHQGTY